MAKQNALRLTLSAIAGAVAALLFYYTPGALTTLAEGIGLWLRTLSLLGQAGNLAAWTICLAASSLPAIWLLVQKKRRGLDWEDALLVILALQILYTLCKLTNLWTLIIPSAPGLNLSGLWSPSALLALAATLLSYALLRLLRRLDSGVRLFPFRRLLAVAAMLLVFLSVLGGLRGYLAQTQSDTAANFTSTNAQSLPVSDGRDVILTPYQPGTGTSSLLQGILALLNLIPSFLGAAVLFQASDLFAALEADPFAEETVMRCRATARLCRKAASASVLLCVGGNLLQLLLSPLLLHIEISLTLPLITVLISAGLFLLCRYFQQGKDLSDDNRSII